MANVGFETEMSVCVANVDFEPGESLLTIFTRKNVLNDFKCQMAAFSLKDERLWAKRHFARFEREFDGRTPVLNRALHC